LTQGQGQGHPKHEKHTYKIHIFVLQHISNLITGS